MCRFKYISNLWCKEERWEIKVKSGIVFDRLIFPKCEAITKHPVRSADRESSGRCLQDAKYIIEGHMVCWNYLWAIENKNKPIEFVE